MKITLRNLRALLKESISEDANDIQGKIYFAYRSLTPGSQSFINEFFPGINAGHSWVMVKDPKSGEITSYSGKSGAVFGPGLLLRRLGIGRGDSVDEVFSKIKKKYDEGEISSEEMMEFFKELQWENLVKIKNWESDTLKTADIITPVMPRKGDSQEDLDHAIQNIKTSFENYNNDTPYDPLPGSRPVFGYTPESGQYTRNSNSFAYTLLRQAFRDLGEHAELANRVGSLKLDLPGWGKIVGGITLNEKREDKMKISRKDLRRFILETVYEFDPNRRKTPVAPKSDEEPGELIMHPSYEKEKEEERINRLVRNVMDDITSDPEFYSANSAPYEDPSEPGYAEYHMSDLKRGADELDRLYPEDDVEFDAYLKELEQEKKREDDLRSRGVTPIRSVRHHFYEDDEDYEDYED